MSERSEMELFDRIGEAQSRWNVLRHPFYERWERGELSREDLGLYAAEYRQAVVAIAAAAERSGDEEHAREEQDHVALWDEFAAAVGAPTDREPTPETRDCVEAWRANDPDAAQAVLYAIESAQPAIAETKLRGLVEHFGFRGDEAATRYFSVHAERDVAHAASARRALASLDVEEAPRLAETAERALRANWRLLDGVQRLTSPA